MKTQPVAASTARLIPSRLWRRLTILVLLECLLFLRLPHLSAQTSITGAQIRNPLTPVAALPLTCQPYTTYYLTTTNTPYICTATNIFTALAATGLADTGCTAAQGAITCPSGFTASGPFSVTGQQQSAALFTNPPAGSISLVFDSDNAGHLVRKDSGGGLHDLEVTRIGGYEIGSENSSAAIVTADLTSHSFVINNAQPKTLTEASCTTDGGSQSLTVKIGGTTLFTITCVAFGSYSSSSTDGTTGYLIASAMQSTAIAAHAQLDLSGTANGTTKDLKLFIYGAF